MGRNTDTRSAAEYTDRRMPKITAPERGLFLFINLFKLVLTSIALCVRVCYGWERGTS
jgi:hypothetical protein